MSSITSPPAAMKYALLTCLDSSFDVAAMLQTSAALKPMAAHASVVGHAVLVATSNLVAAHHVEPIFHGFDEVWFVARRRVAPQPPGIHLIGPEEVSREVPAELARWMDQNKCSLALGDGTTLNFVARLEGVARFLLERLLDAPPAESAPRPPRG